jgi:Flp pilus assembly protein TadD
MAFGSALFFALVCRASHAAALMESGRTSDAVNQLERAIALKPNHELAYYLLGLALKEQRQLKEAERRMRQALSISVKYVEACATLSDVLAEQKRFHEAERTACHALEIEPRSATALASLAIIRCGKDIKRDWTCCEP